MTEADHGGSAAAADRARERARSAIAELVRDTAGDDAFRTVPIVPGGRTTEHRPEPRHGLRAALRLRSEVTGHMRRYVEELRGAGVSWLDIAAEVRRDPEADHEQATAVFEEFAVGDEVDASWLSWRCNSCRERVLDHGPWNPHPDDIERGHALDCSRHADEVQAYEQERTD